MMSLRSWLSLLGIYITYLIIGMITFRALEFCESDIVVKDIEIPIQGKKLFCKYHILIWICKIAISNYIVVITR